MSLDILQWPAVPDEQRPRKLYHMEGLSAEHESVLKEYGWEPIDLRLMPSGSLEERSIACLAWLEGVRLGSIQPNPGQAKFVELEMKACGILSGKSEVPDQEEKFDLDKVLETLGKRK